MSPCRSAPARMPIRIRQQKPKSFWVFCAWPLSTLRSPRFTHHVFRGCFFFSQRLHLYLGVLILLRPNLCLTSDVTAPRTSRGLFQGVLTGDDAVRAASHGAAAVYVSNHGGRQLDGSPATLLALPEVRAAVGDALPVYFDGGIRLDFLPESYILRVHHHTGVHIRSTA